MVSICASLCSEELRQPLSLAGAHFLQLGEHPLEQRDRLGADFLHVRCRLCDHSRPAQHVERVCGREAVAQLGDTAARFMKASHQVFVQQQAAAGLVLEMQPQRAIDLAARQPLAQQLACRCLDMTQRVGKAQLGFQIAMVDRTNLPGKRTPGQSRFAAGKRGHTVNG